MGGTCGASCSGTREERHAEFAVSSAVRRAEILVLLLAAVLAGILVVASRREYRERKALLGRIGQYVGYLEILRGLPQAQGVRIGIARENTVGSGKGADIILRAPVGAAGARAIIYAEW